MIDSQPDRQCSCCKEELPASFFLISGGSNQCRSCKKERDRNRQWVDHRAADSKVCSTCSKTLPGSSFSARPKEVSGLQPLCKVCYKMRRRDYRARLRSVPHLKSTLPSSRLCNKCGQEKPLSDFHARTASFFTVQSHCKMCFQNYESGHQT